MISPTDSEVFKTMGPNSFDWEDYFWCEECEDECWPIEDDEEIESERHKDSI